MATLWEKIKAYLSGWPIGKDEPELEPKKKKSAKKPKGLNPKKNKKSKGKKQGNLT